ncbi:MAG: DUF2490 domain-containing protein [Prevotella sp.]|nr:DUF2490 domain-containing protein [Prevotella sp.]
MMKKIVLATIVALLLPLAVSAQSDDFGLWYSVGAEKKLSQKLSLEAEVELRTLDDAKKTDRWSGSIGADYKINKWVKASAGYTFIYDKKEKRSYSYYDDEDDEDEPWEGKVKKAKCADYWGPRHRFNVDVTASQTIGRWKFSLRERWQYTYRPEKTVTRDVCRYVYDLDGALSDGYPTTEQEQKTYNKKYQSVMRTRFQTEYNIPKCKIDPFANVEFCTSMDDYKVRYTFGFEWKLSKQHVFNVAYRYQDIHEGAGSDSDDEPNMHIVGFGYKFKF